MTTMKVARLHAVGGQMVLEDVPVPTLRPTDVLVEVKACNFVPNLKNVLDTWPEWFPYLPMPKLPAVFGLDSAGVVKEVGSEVTGWSVGDRVYVNPALSCGACRACRAGESQACPAYTFMAYFSFSPDGQRLYDAYPYGGFGEFLTAPQQNLVRLPDKVSFEHGARFGYLGTAFSAMRKGGVGPGRTVLIDGIGGTLGVGAALIALGLGATKILGTGRNSELLADVKALDPDRIEVLAAGSRPVAEWAREHTDGIGVDVLVDALAPAAPAQALLDAISGLRRGGVAINIGGMMEPAPLNLLWMMTAGISLIGSLWFTTSEAQDMADMAGAGVLDLSVFENEVYPLADVNQALASMAERHGGFSNFIIAP